MASDKILELAEQFEKFAQDEGKLWALVHDTYEPEGVGEDYPVVRHIFIGKNKKEAEGYYKSHTKTCEFMRECDKDGKWEQVKCDTKKSWKQIDKKELK